MEEFNTKTKEKIEVTNQVKKDLQKQWVGTFKPKPNHIVFEVNVIDQTIIPAKFDKNLSVAWSQANKGKAKKSISTNKDCIYISALNKKNVLKILKRDFGLVTTK
jgi:hypothetical protein